MSLYGINNNKSTGKSNNADKKSKYITVYNINNNPKVFRLKDFRKLDHNEVVFSDMVVRINLLEFNRLYLIFNPDFNGCYIQGKKGVDLCLVSNVKFGMSCLNENMKINLFEFNDDLLEYVNDNIVNYKMFTNYFNNGIIRYSSSIDEKTLTNLFDSFFKHFDCNVKIVHYFICNQSNNDYVNGIKQIDFKLKLNDTFFNSGTIELKNKGIREQEFEVTKIKI